MTEPRAKVRNATDKEQLRRAKRSDRIAQRQREADLSVVMASAQCRRFVWWLLGEAGIHRSVLNQGPDMALYWAGQQDFSHKLLERLTKEQPDNYLLMQREAIEAERAEPDAPVKEGQAETEETLGDPEE